MSVSDFGAATGGGNPFASADPWEVSTDTMLPVGNHLVSIVEAEGSTVKSSQNPQIELRFENSEGSIRAWESYHGGFLSRVVALFESAGVERPKEGEFDPNDKCRINDAVIDRLLNKQIGIVVRDEDDNQNPGQKRRRVKGYVVPAKITGGADTRDLPSPGASQASAADDDIPF